MVHRQTCAQMLRLFLAREQDPSSAPSTHPTDLDALYHQYTAFDPQGESAKRFERVLELSGKVFELATQYRSSGAGKRKFRKLDVFAVALLLQDLTRNPGLRLDRNAIEKIAGQLVTGTVESAVQQKGSGQKVKAHYEAFRMALGDIGIRLDPTRAFAPEQREEIFRKSAGKCAICNDAVLEDDAEYDHYPVPHRDGGPTIVENGRLVHRVCHPRGRPKASEAYA